MTMPSMNPRQVPRNKARLVLLGAISEIIKEYDLSPAEVLCILLEEASRWSLFIQKTEKFKKK